MIKFIVALVLFSGMTVEAKTPPKGANSRPFLSSLELGSLPKSQRVQYMAELGKQGHLSDPDLKSCIANEPFNLCRLGYALFIHSSMQKCQPKSCKKEAQLSQEYRKKIAKGKK